MLNNRVIEATINRMAPRLDALKANVANHATRQMLSDADLDRRRGALVGGPVVPTKADFERILGTNDLVDLRYLQLGLNAGRSVCRVILRSSSGREIGYGTGFLVAPRVLLTNHHVIESADAADTALAEFDYEVDFSGRPRPTTRFAFATAEGFYANEALDFALIALAEAPLLGARASSEFGYLRLNPTLGKIAKGEFMSVIQHPAGQPKQLGLRENRLLEIPQGAGVDNFLWYTTDTAPGSSGSPVFNDAWQVVGLHHSGVPRRNAGGDWLMRDGTIAAKDADDAQIDWIANEAIRVSRIVQHLEAKVRGRFALFDRCLEVAKSGPDSLPQEMPSEAIAKGNGHDQQPWVRQTPGGAVVTVPISFSVSLQGAQSKAITADPDVSLPGVQSVPAPIVADESANIDPDYDSRKGYVAGFLGPNLPLPQLTDEAKPSAALTSAKQRVLRYCNYSLIQNAERRMPFLVAWNIDADLNAHTKFGLTRKAMNAKDVWVPDPRIPLAAQLDNRFFLDTDGFDRGHVARREDCAWGKTKSAAILANNDTFHFTNCTPQIDAFNRAKLEGLDGIWGMLEDHIGDELSTSGKLSVIGGPILRHDDPAFAGVQVPIEFWKIVVTETNGELEAYGFLLSQEDRLDRASARELAAAELFDPGAFKEYMWSLGKLQEHIALLVFPQELVAADQFAHLSDEKMQLTSLELIHQTRSGAVLASAGQRAKNGGARGGKRGPKPPTA